MFLTDPFEISRENSDGIIYFSKIKKADIPRLAYGLLGIYLSPDGDGLYFNAMSIADLEEMITTGESPLGY